jgi:hypothetical protein
MQHAYLLIRDRQLDAARAEMGDVRRLAKARYADAHPIYRVIEYLDALIARPDDSANALRALETGAGRKVRLPIGRQHGSSIAFVGIRLHAVDQFVGGEMAHGSVPRIFFKLFNA